MVEEKKPKLYKPDMMYRPKKIGFDEMSANTRKAIGDQKPLDTNQGVPTFRDRPFRPTNIWKPDYEKKYEERANKPIGSFYQQKTIPKAGFPTYKPYPAKQELEKKKEEEEQEPYWSGDKWEEWAYEMYSNYPEMRKYLPDWFIQAVEENNEEKSK